MSDFKLYAGKKFVNISTDEAIALFKDGSKKALDKVFEGNLSLVTYTIEKNFRAYSDKEELFQVGSMGLWKAITKYRLSLGNAFSTYAIPSIEGEIRCFIGNNSSLIRVSKGKKDLIVQINKIKDEYQKCHGGQEIPLQVLSDLLDISIEDIEDAMIASYSISSLDDCISNDTDNLTLKDTIVDSSINIMEEYEAKESKEIIMNYLAQQSKRNQDIIRLYYGINCKKKTQEEIASIYGISRSHVSGIAKNFKKDIYRKLGYKVLKEDNVQEKRKMFVPKENIYEQLSQYDSNLINEELSKLPKEQLSLVNEFYQNSIGVKGRKKAIDVIKRIKYNLALRTVKQEENIVSKDKQKVLKLDK